MNSFHLCSSVGKGKSKLTSFDNALLVSGVANFNLVKISSILPPHLLQSDKVNLPEGSILYTAFANISTCEKDRVISAAIAVGIPNNPNDIGVIMEFADNCGVDDAKRIVSDMVIEAMNNRKIKIKEILCEASEGIGDGLEYVTAFAALAMW